MHSIRELQRELGYQLSLLRSCLNIPLLSVEVFKKTLVLLVIILVEVCKILLPK